MIADEGKLQNEFMEVTISPDSGGISGVYSGQTRGNRLSMRLTRSGLGDSGGEVETAMRCKTLRVISSTPAVGCIEAEGELTSAQGKSLADFTLCYTLARGSRVIQVEGSISPIDQLNGDAWHDYIACRVAVATEAAIHRALLRDKAHRSRSRRIVAPLGVVIDEAERQTLIASGGLAFHRRVGDRFLDTLVATHGETNPRFTLWYGFDVPTPVSTARALIAPPAHVPISAAGDTAEIGWIVHVAPKELLISRLKVDRRQDGQLAAILRVTQTRSQACKASIRFCRDVRGALELDGPSDDPLNLPLPEARTGGCARQRDNGQREKGTREDGQYGNRQRGNRQRGNGQRGNGQRGG